MTSSGLVGLVAIAAAVLPGYVYVRIAERRQPRRERTGILLAAELAFVGLLTSALSGLIVLSAAESLDLAETESLLLRTRTYAAVEPQRTLLVLLATSLLSFGLAWMAAVLSHRGMEAFVRPGWSVWHYVLEPGRRKQRVFATVELRDGRRFSGYVSSYDLEEDREKRDLALQYPIFASTGEAHDSTPTFS